VTVHGRVAEIQNLFLDRVNLPGGKAGGRHQGLAVFFSDPDHDVATAIPAALLDSVNADGFYDFREGLAC